MYNKVKNVRITNDYQIKLMEMYKEMDEAIILSDLKCYGYCRDCRYNEYCLSLENLEEAINHLNHFNNR